MSSMSPEQVQANRGWIRCRPSRRHPYYDNTMISRVKYLATPLHDRTHCDGYKLDAFALLPASFFLSLREGFFCRVLAPTNLARLFRCPLGVANLSRSV